MRVLWVGVAVFLFAVPAVAAAQEPSGKCAYDRAAMLRLDPVTFDQSPKGWRQLAKSGCERETADLIQAYRFQPNRDSGILAFHEAVYRARGGDYSAALPLLERSKHGGPVNEWDLYVDATEAFLRNDAAGMQRARNAMAALPETPANREAAAELKARTGQTVQWPPNLSRVDRLIECRGRPYALTWTEEPCMVAPASKP